MIIPQLTKLGRGGSHLFEEKRQSPIFCIDFIWKFVAYVDAVLFRHIGGDSCPSSPVPEVLYRSRERFVAHISIIVALYTKYVGRLIHESLANCSWILSQLFTDSVESF